MNRTRSHIRALLALVGAATALALTAGSLLAISWIHADRISGSDTVLENDTTSITTSGSKVAVAWARGEDNAGISILLHNGDTWAADPVRRYAPPGQTAWSPSVSYPGPQASSQEAALAWAQGLDRNTCGSPHEIVQYDVNGSSHTVVTGAYGNATAPDLVAGDTGWHIVYAAATSEVACAAGLDLYYSYRPYTATDWAPPTVVITSGQVISASAQGGGVWYPRIAAAPGSSTVDVVWEQFQLFPPSDTSIWTVSGTLQGETVSWSSPARLSPSWQTFAGRPMIAANVPGQVHVVWSQLIGSWSANSDQYVYYQMLQRGSPMSLNSGEPFHATKGSPAVVGTSIAALGDHVCITWHGFTGTSGSEEVTVRCSRNAGVSWRTPINVSESPAMLSVYPDVAIDTTDTVHFSWVESEFSDDKWSPQGVYYRNSTWVTLLPIVMRGR